MARSLSPFTRLTLLVSELNGNKLVDLINVKKCDLLHHTMKLSEEITDASQKDSALIIQTQGKQLFDLITAGDMAAAETAREVLIKSCKQLKDLV